MAEFTVDPYAELYAGRTAGMAASEVRALFAVASRPDVVSFAGGMPFVEALPTDAVADLVRSVIAEHAGVERIMLNHHLYDDLDMLELVGRAVLPAISPS